MLRMITSFVQNVVQAYFFPHRKLYSAVPLYISSVHPNQECFRSTRHHHQMLEAQLTFHMFYTYNPPPKPKKTEDLNILNFFLICTHTVKPTSNRDTYQWNQMQFTHFSSLLFFRSSSFQENPRCGLKDIFSYLKKCQYI